VRDFFTEQGKKAIKIASENFPSNQKISPAARKLNTVAGILNAIPKKTNAGQGK
jgi:hypothetical protein